jgi:hypothetical protein
LRWRKVAYLNWILKADAERDLKSVERGREGGRLGGVKIALLWREWVFSFSVTSHSWNIGKRVGLCWHVWGRGAYIVKWAFDKIDVVVFLFTSEKNLLHFNFVLFFRNCGKINFQYFLIYITIIIYFVIFSLFHLINVSFQVNLKTCSLLIFLYF